MGTVNYTRTLKKTIMPLIIFLLTEKSSKKKSKG